MLRPGFAAWPDSVEGRGEIDKMRLRYAYLENRYNLGDSGENTTDITVREPFDELWLELRCANNGDNLNNRLYDIIDELQVIDGSKVLYSLDGYEQFAVQAHKLGKIPWQYFEESSGQTQIASIPLLFGRYRGDPEYAFDPTKFLNPQFRIKWNLANIHAVGSEGFTSGGLYMTLIAKVHHEGPTPRGMLTTKQVYTWTGGADATEFISQPTDHKIQAFMLRLQVASQEMQDILSNIKLNCDGDKHVPFDLRGEDLLNMIVGAQPRFEYHQSFKCDVSDTKEELLHYFPMLSWNMGQTDYVANWVQYKHGNGTLKVTMAGSQLSGRYGVQCVITGFCPYRCVWIPMGDPEDPLEWFDAPVFNTVRLEVKTGVASTSAYEVLVQEYLY